jgi:hypothetical protein
VLDLEIDSPEGIAGARHRIHDELEAAGIDHAELGNLMLVASELIGAAFDADTASPVVISVQRHPRLTTIRVRCGQAFRLPDDPMRLRERVLQGITVAHGQRRNIDNTVILWAEVPISHVHPP